MVWLLAGRKVQNFAEEMRCGVNLEIAFCSILDAKTTTPDPFNPAPYLTW